VADLALNNSLIDEYLKYKFQDDYTPNTIRKLFKYIQPFSIREGFSDDPSMAMQMESDPLIEIVDNCSDEELVQDSILKLMLVDKASFVSYRTLNIDDGYEKLKPKYVGTYLNSMGKDNAQQHIKALLSDAKYITITDGYIASWNSWNSNKLLLQDIIPFKELDLNIIGADKEAKRFSLSASEKSELENLCDSWTVKVNAIGQNIHDRYIETDNLKILLSSGISHLSSTSNKDFTYVVEIK